MKEVRVTFFRMSATRYEVFLVIAIFLFECLDRRKRCGMTDKIVWRGYNLMQWMQSNEIQKKIVFLQKLLLLKARLWLNF